MLTTLRTYAGTALVNRALRGQVNGDLQAYRHLERLHRWPFGDDDRATATMTLIGVVTRDMPRAVTGHAELRFASIDLTTGEERPDEPNDVPADLLCWGRMTTAFLCDDIDTACDLWDGYVAGDHDRARKLLRLALETAGAVLVGGTCTCDHGDDHP